MVPWMHVILIISMLFLFRIYEMAMLYPPFRANDMKGLVAKVNRGVYEPIKNYSNDLSLIVDTMIKVKILFRLILNKDLQVINFYKILFCKEDKIIN